ncbi:MAG: hypothetical protein M3352_03550 [Bacteroidota bacterium]|nr:hypothetical protein [Bacteroidota bacterium]
MKNIFSSKSLFIVSVLFLVIAIVSCYSTRRSLAIEDGWDLLGEEKVNFVRDKDEIDVRSRGVYTDIRFKVEDREVRINDLKIYFQNGDKLEPSIDFVIGANQESRIIELSKDGRNIDKIEFRYRTTGNILQGRANILVFGKRYNAGF